MPSTATDLGCRELSAYEDMPISSQRRQEVDGKRSSPHGLRQEAPDSLGFTATGSGWPVRATWRAQRLPGGRVGIRMEGCRPVAQREPAGRRQRPAAQYALRKYLEWLRKYAPPGRWAWTSTNRLPSLAKGNVASRSSGTPPSPRTW